jgi:hypothetical protein
VISRDRDFAMCIAHEEPGQGPSVERLLTDRSFKEAAALLEPGVSVPVAILPTDAAPWLAAWLDKRGLQLDRDGDEWFVTQRNEPGAALAARLGIAIHVLLPPLLFALFALLSNACTPAPQGRWVNGDAALTAVLEQYTGRQPSPSELVPVYVVPSNCTAAGMPGFLDSGDCRGGLTLGHEGIYLVENEQHRFSDHLAHEAQHLLGLDHPGAADWAHDSEVFKQIVAASLYLLARPELDHIAEDPRK